MPSEAIGISTPVLSTKINGMVYKNCRTRIIDLQSLNLPSDRSTSDAEYRQIYNKYISANKSPDSPQHVHSRHLASAVMSLTTGIAPPVAFPTETVYGLGADATNASSIAGIFAAKGRPSDNPLIVHVSSVEHLERCLGGTSDKSAIPTIYHDLIHEFWPGPLTILIPAPSEGQGGSFAPNVHPGQPTIGFRLPSSPYARFLIAVTDRPIAAPSANSSGKPSPTNAKHVLDDLDGKINFILDGGSCDVGVESTVVDGLGPVPLILRPGGLSKIELKRWGKEEGNAWANVENGWEVKKQGVKRKRNGDTSKQSNGIGEEHDGSSSHVNGTNTFELPGQHHDETEGAEEDILAAPRAPGMKYKHYSPNARMFLIESSTTPASTSSTRDFKQSTDHSPSITTVHDLVTDILKQSNDFRNTADPSTAENGDSPTHNARPPSSSPVVSILTSTCWPPFANVESCLPDWKMTKSSKEPAWSHMRLTTPTNPDNSSAPKAIDIYSLDLGRDSSTISNRLFAALRTCDDLRSDFIFAEAPLRTEENEQDANHLGNSDAPARDDDDEFETVLERMRKAASEIVQS